MRRSREAKVLLQDGKLYGFNLGADFTSEHEWGVDKLKRAFGVSNTKNKIFGGVKQILGVDARTITKLPTDMLHYGGITIDKKEYYFFICCDSYFSNIKEITVDMLKGFEIYPFKEDVHIFTAWDEDSFGILVDDTYKKELSDLYEAFNRKDIVIGIGKSGAFNNGGLTFLVRSLIPESTVQGFYESDLDVINLKKAAEKTGIEKILKEAGKKYYALSPSWKDKTKTEVIFWLNPVEQNIYNFGWFDVEKLKQWANNEGPVIMKKKRG